MTYRGESVASGPGLAPEAGRREGSNPIHPLPPRSLTAVSSPGGGSVPQPTGSAPKPTGTLITSGAGTVIPGLALGLIAAVAVVSPLF